MRFKINEFSHSLAHETVLADTRLMESMKLTVNREAGHVIAAPLEVATHAPEHIHEGKHEHSHVREDTPTLSLLDEIKMEAAQRGTISSKSIELQTTCGCGTCPPCLSITVWNVGSLIVPAIKVMAGRRRNKSH